MVHEKVLAFQNAIFLSNFLIKKNATNHIICGISSLLFDQSFESISIAQSRCLLSSNQSYFATNNGTAAFLKIVVVTLPKKN